MLARFLDDLFDHGRVAVGPPELSWDAEELDSAVERLRVVEQRVRAQAPGTPPEFERAAAEWSAAAFYRASQAAVFRELPAEAVERLFATPPADEATRVRAAWHYTVDLVFQFLPDLHRLASAASPADPLVDGLRAWARFWPLSSVGMSDVTVDSLAGIIEHPGLLALYVDRVIARRDVGRLDAPIVLQAVRRAIGPYADQFADAPEFYRRLR